MKILVFQHLAVEHPGILRDFWRESDHQWHTVELDAGEPIPDLEGYDLLVAMGGPMDVWQQNRYPWLANEKAAIREWLRELDRPYLGICLGHQLLAEALGGQVAPMAEPEVGLANVDLTPAGRRDPLFAGFDTRLQTLQWHGAEVSRIPQGAEILATNSACQVQAIRWGRHAYGFQYHIEMTASTVSDWEAIPEYRASLEQALGRNEAAQLSGKVAARLPDFQTSARLLNSNLQALIRLTHRTNVASPYTVAVN